MRLTNLIGSMSLLRKSIVTQQEVDRQNWEGYAGRALIAEVHGTGKFCTKMWW